MKRKLTKREYANILLEQHPYAILSTDSGYQIHLISEIEYTSQKVLVTFENEAFVRTLYHEQYDSYFIHNNKRIYLSSFYKV